MLRSDSLRRTLVISISALALTLSASTAAAAKKKKPASSPAPTTEAAPKAEEPAKPAGPVAPTPDSMGRIHFGPPSAPDTGIVTVKAPPGQQIQVHIEGKYFGIAPVTIHSVPRGDYIVEGTTPDGKTINRAVAVNANEEAVADLSGAAGLTPTEGIATQGGISPKRVLAAKVVAATGVAALVVGTVFGIMEIRKENEYEKLNSPTEAERLNVWNDGKRYARFANVGFGVGAACLIAAGVLAYPLFINKPEQAAQPPRSPEASVIVLPNPNGGATAAVGFTF